MAIYEHCVVCKGFYLVLKIKFRTILSTSYICLRILYVGTALLLNAFISKGKKSYYVLYVNGYL